MKEAISFTIASKAIKYLGSYSMRGLHNKNYKNLMKEIKEDKKIFCVHGSEGLIV